MAYLSQYILSQNAVRALRLTDTYSLHRAVYDLFEDVRGGERQEHSGILFADKGGNAKERTLLILSTRPPRPPNSPNSPDSPNLTGLPGLPGSLNLTGHGTLETRTLPPEYLTGKAYRFAIVMNPVRRENSSGKLLPLRDREAVAAWFCAKAPMWGFQVREESLLVASLAVDSFRKGGHDVTLSKASLSGFLDVIDSTLFAASVVQGLGRGRAFGCGLLQITPSY